MQFSFRQQPEREQAVCKQQDRLRRGTTDPVLNIQSHAASILIFQACGELENLRMWLCVSSIKLRNQFGGQRSDSCQFALSVTDFERFTDFAVQHSFSETGLIREELAFRIAVPCTQQ